MTPEPTASSAVAPPLPAAVDTGLPAPGAGHGIHKIFLGFAPGVGKTFSMLSEAHRRQRRGEDVVVAIVETHGRRGTREMIEGLEVVPRLRIEYRGLQLEEMDTTAVIARHPRVALVDELAHTNVPGLKHAKRYEDALEILAAGIDVVSTLNIQHIESLNPVIHRMTGVQVRETVPDWVVERADEKVLVDVTPEALIHRMERGDIYAPGKTPQALAHFFQPRNLLALRELALRQTAEEADAAYAHLAGNEAMLERIGVCIAANFTGQDLISRGWRLAPRLRAPLIVVHVRTPAEEMHDAQLEANLQFAGDLGAEIVMLDAADPASAIAQFARERRLTQLIVGRPRRMGWRSYLPNGFLPRLIRELPGVDFHLVSFEHPAAELTTAKDTSAPAPSTGKP